MTPAHVAPDKLSFVRLRLGTSFFAGSHRKRRQMEWLRRLDGRDLAGIERHLLELDMVSRNRRFLSGFGDAAVAAYVRRLDVTTDILFGAIEQESGRIVGLAEVHPAGVPRTVEVGTSVLATHRRRGLARELISRAVAVAFAQGATAAELLFDPSNAAAAGIAAALGARTSVPGRAILRPAGG
jgi:GNAT superfamily N-acetyltransferase